MRGRLRRVARSIGTDFVPYSLIGALALQSQPASYGGEHPGGEDRAGDIMCWTVGGRTQLLFDPNFAQLIEPFVIAGRDCVAEYQDRLSTVRRWLPGYGGTTLAERPFSEGTSAVITTMIAASDVRDATTKRESGAPKMSVRR